MIKKDRLYGIIVMLLLVAIGCKERDKSNGTLSIRTGIEIGKWVKVPAGSFWQGQHNDKTHLDYDFDIMNTNVTPKEYAVYLNQALESGWVKLSGDTIRAFHKGDPFDAYSHEVKIEDGDKIHMILERNGVRIRWKNGKFYAEKGYENHPIVMVSWYGAQAYCNYYGWNLPLELEWEKAARGTDKRAYPWGNKISPSYANYYASGDPYEELFGKTGGTTPVGFYNGDNYLGFETTNAQSPYGLFDMAGNTWEWTADDYSDVHYRYMRGGSNANYGTDLRVWIRNSAGPEYMSINVGFRCVKRNEK